MEEVSETLRKAYDAVAAAGIPEYLHEAAFRDAMRLLAPAAPAAAPAVVTPAHRVTPTGSTIVSTRPAAETEAAEVSEAVLYDRVVTQTGADRAKVERLVHMDGGVPTVTLPGLRLGKNNAEKTRRVAAILTIVRGFGLGEIDTSLEVVRAEAIRLKCYDSPNFASQLSKLEGFVITGSGQNRRIRAKAPGIAAFPALVELLIEEA